MIQLTTVWIMCSLSLIKHGLGTRRSRDEGTTAVQPGHLRASAQRLYLCGSGELFCGRAQHPPCAGRGNCRVLDIDRATLPVSTFCPFAGMPLAVLGAVRFELNDEALEFRGAGERRPAELNTKRTRPNEIFPKGALVNGQRSCVIEP
jgi:hypothetical protein